MHEPRKNLNVVLLPDGRVLSAGQTDGTMQTSAELYSPPYLFAGPRPVIDAAPSTVGYGSSFAVSTSQAASIDSVALVRANSSTHGVNFDQRHVPLSFSAGAGGLTVSAPASGAQAPPGWYMLFLINDAGVPSVASWVKVS
ncbi:MAG: galactose oxidase early set domain-containing protein [Actinomycetota bacterium]